MSANLQRHHEFTEEEYWRRERDTEEKNEFQWGQIYAMAGISTDHNRIAGDVFALIHAQLRDKPCEPFVGDQRIKVEATTLRTYPDIFVACPPFSYDPNDKHTMLDAVVIIEVLSPSTANYDRNEKFDNYKKLKSLRHYLLIEQKQIKVTHHYKDADEQWHSETFAAPEDIMELRAIECQLVLRQIYKRVHFDAI